MMNIKNVNVIVVCGSHLFKQFDSYITNQNCFSLLNIILYVLVNSFSVMLGWVFLRRTSTKRGFMCPAQ